MRGENDMPRKEPTREIKTDRIMQHIEDAIPELDDEELDTLLFVAQQYNTIALERKERRARA